MIQRFQQLAFLASLLVPATNVTAALLYYDVGGAFDFQDIETPPGFSDTWSVPVPGGDVGFKLVVDNDYGAGASLGTLARYDADDSAPPGGLSGQASADLAITNRLRLSFGGEAVSDAGVKFVGRLRLDSELNDGGSPDPILGDGFARAGAGFSLIAFDSVMTPLYFGGEVSCSTGSPICSVNVSGDASIFPEVTQNDLSFDPVSGMITGGVTFAATLPKGASLRDINMVTGSLIEFNISAGYQFPEPVMSDNANTATFIFSSPTPGVEVQVVPLPPGLFLLAPILAGLTFCKRKFS